jgi:hypothetical protein
MKTDLKENIPKINIARRSFLRRAGVGAASISLLATAACHKDHQIIIKSGKIDIGKGDISVLNYAYALEQLEAAFYTQLIQTPYSGITTDELAIFTTIRDQEILHREFFKAALGANAIPALVTDFTTIDFTSRNSVFVAAKSLEDIGVLAYIGSGYMIQNKDYLTVAAKIASVEARHAALLSNMITPGSFSGSDQVNATGLNNFLGIAEALYLINTYLKTKVNAIYYNYQV